MDYPRPFKLPDGKIIDLNYVIAISEIEDGTYNIYEKERSDKITHIQFKYSFRYMLTIGREYEISEQHFYKIVEGESYDPKFLQEKIKAVRKEMIHEWVTDKFLQNLPQFTF